MVRNSDTEDVEGYLARLSVEGFCIIENVIPPDRVGVVCDAVLGAVESVSDETLAKAAEVRSKGHRLNAQGVQAVPGPALPPRHPEGQPSRRPHWNSCSTYRPRSC